MGDTNWLMRTLKDVEKRAEELPSWFKDNHPTWREIRAREAAAVAGLITAKEAREMSHNSDAIRIDKQIREVCSAGLSSTVFRYLSEDSVKWLRNSGFLVEKRTTLAGTKDIWHVSW